jgi:hypothetical protein
MSLESDGGMILKGENRRTRRKACPSATLSTTILTWIDPGANPCLRGERPATNDLSHGTAHTSFLVYFPNMKIGLWHDHALCLSLQHINFEQTGRFSWNLVAMWCHSRGPRYNNSNPIASTILKWLRFKFVSWMKDFQPCSEIVRDYLHCWVTTVTSYRVLVLFSIVGFQWSEHKPSLADVIMGTKACNLANAMKLY